MRLRTRWLVVAAVLALAQSASVAVQAQSFWNWNQQDQSNRQRSRPQSGGLFDWFGGGQNNSRPRDDDYRPPRQRQYQHTQQEPSESSRAPPPKKAEAKDEQTEPTTSIVVIGDDMADWLGYGLEDVFSDTPEIRVVRKNKLNSGLLRYDAKGDLDWWHVARDTVAQEKADYVVMMLGIGDRQDIREKDLAKEADTRAKDQQAKDQAAKDPQAKEEAEKKGGQKPAKTNDADENATPSAQRAKKTGGSAEFRSDEWEKVYSRRIDDTIAALKSKGVPVIWVGLPPIRGARSSGDTAYLNELYRARAERAGIKYVDVWDGFVDEAGKYSNYGPDYEGQVRRLRSSDGVFFTKAGAIKLARYVEQELSRYISNRVPVALPSGPFEATPSESRPTERPLMGPVIPMSGMPKDKKKTLTTSLDLPAAIRSKATRLPRKFWRRVRQWLPRPAVPIILRGRTAVKPNPPRLRQKLQLRTSPSQGPSQRLCPALWPRRRSTSGNRSGRRAALENSRSRSRRKTRHRRKLRLQGRRRMTCRGHQCR